MSRKQSSKRGYGLHNVEKRKLTKKEIDGLLSKSWNDISFIELVKLVHFGKTTEGLARHYKTSTIAILNKLRLS